MIEIRSYSPKDYPEFRRLYEQSGWFDELIDSEEVVNRQIQSEPGAILLAFSGNQIVGTATLLTTGRMGLFFRLISDDINTRKQLLTQGEKFFKAKGCQRIDIIAPEEDAKKQSEYSEYGFVKGNLYRWFWKENL